MAFPGAVGVPWVQPESDGSSQGTLWPPDVTQGPPEQRELLCSSSQLMGWPSHGESWLRVTATSVVVFSHVPQQRLHCTCRKNVCVKPTPPSTTFHPPSNPLKIPLYQTCKCLAPVRLLQSLINFTNWPKHFLVEKPCIPEAFSLIKLLPYHRSWLLFL